MRKEFEHELKQLEVSFIDMSRMAYYSLEDAISAFKKQNIELAKSIILSDQEINQQEIDIELTCARLLALQQPVVTDLRLVISIMKACSDLERIGDHAASIAKSVVKLEYHQSYDKIEAEIVAMADLVLDMLKRLAAAFQNRDEKEARAISLIDSEVDSYMKAISKLNLTEMQANQDMILVGTQYRSIARHLARIADYTTNVCERIVYIQTGHLVEFD